MGYKPIILKISEVWAGSRPKTSPFSDNCIKNTEEGLIWHDWTGYILKSNVSSISKTVFAKVFGRSKINNNKDPLIF